MLRSIQPYTRCALALSGLALLLGILAGCLRDRPEELPSRLVWNPDVAIPIGRDSFGFNVKSGFDTALLAIDPRTQLPGWVELDFIDLSGEIDFSLASLDQSADELNRILFRFIVYNGFPLNAESQGYFLDPSGFLIDSFFTQGPVELPPGSSRGLNSEVEPSITIKDATFDRERMNPLRNANSIRVRTRLFRPAVIDTSLIPFYENYQIKLDIGVMLDLTIEF